MTKFKNLFLLFTFLLLTCELQAQIIEFPLPVIHGHQFRIKNDSLPIDLPLWDDFSNSDRFTDTTFWVSNTAIFINPGIGKNAPTLNVATFDGWDAHGIPYSQDPLFTGAADSLVSRPILLNDVPASKRSTVFLSFFYQFEGNGDKPNPNDSLVLQFKKNDGSWITVWPLTGDVVLRQPNIFNQKYIQVTDEFFSDEFQFKFTSYGGLSGPFDTWNLDYIYLDKDRTGSGIDYLDRAFREVPSSIIGPFTAIPLKHFLRDPTFYLDSAAVAFTNLEANVQPVEYSAIVRDLFTGAVIDELVKDSVFLSLRYPLGNKVLKAGFLDPSKLDQTQDSLYLITKFVMDTGDKFLIDSVYNSGQDTVFTSIDLRTNDTTSVITILDDYYAYDDGTAEFGAGVNQLNGRLAVQYIPAGPGILKSIDINFQNIGRTVTGTPITIFVLRDLDRNDFSLLGSLNAVVQVPENLNDFVNYEFGRTIVVTDTFYIGYQQTSNDFVAVGLDKNTNNGDRVYFNITGDWEPNVDLKGSLMIRPRYTDELVTSIQEIGATTFEVYPNPTTGILTISKSPDEVRLYNLHGSELTINLEDKQIDMSDLPPSVYILMLRSDKMWERYKIVKAN